jgi:hypothetical protein
MPLEFELTMVRRLFAVSAVLALFLLGFADCMSALTLDHQSMQCCGSMPCTPANHSHGCCKNMPSPEAPSILPAAHVSLHSPSLIAVEYPRMLAALWETRASAPPTFIETGQHSPPDLYTLHASLLI